MRKIFICSVIVGSLAACNNSAKDTTEKADSANKAARDTAMNNNRPAVDEAGSTFLVKIANSGMAEVQMATMAQKNASSKAVRDLAGMLVHDHSGLNEKVKTLASQKNITLPDSISSDKQSTIEGLAKKTGKNFDKEFLSIMEDSHQSGIDAFQKAVSDVKDADINSLADKTLPTLRMHLDSVKAVRKTIQ